MDLEKLKQALRDFSEVRDWNQFHSPKNLSMALSVEVAELVELFQWLTEAESATPPTEIRNAAEEELADIMIYLARLADKLDINLETAVKKKLLLNESKYPPEKVRGKSKKYSAYDEKPDE